LIVHANEFCNAFTVNQEKSRFSICRIPYKNIFTGISIYYLKKQKLKIKTTTWQH